MLIFIIYFVAAYWAVNQTIVKTEFFWDANLAAKVFVGIILGWILIPIAIIKTRKHRD